MKNVYMKKTYSSLIQNLFLSVFLPGVFLVFSCGYAAYAQASSDTSVTRILNTAYSLIHSNPSEAIKLFEESVALDPTNVASHRQLGYLYNSEGKSEMALQQFRAAEKIQSSDAIKLQIAYVLLSQGNQNEADIILDELQSSSDTEIAEKAKSLRSKPQIEMSSEPIRDRKSVV